MTRQGRAAREFARGAESYNTLFASLFCTSVTVDNLEQSAGYFDAKPHDRVTSEYVVRTLYDRGAIGYIRSLGLWLPASPQGPLNVYGAPTAYRLTGANGMPFFAPADDVVLFRANPEATPIADYIIVRAELLADFDTAISQNLDAVKDMSIIVTDNPNLARKLARADAYRRRGRSVAIVERSAQSFAELKLLTTGAEYKIDKLQADRRKVFEETLHLVNVYTPIEKGERLITSEMTTNNAETDAFGNVLARTFNATAEAYGVPFRIRVLNAAGRAETAQDAERTADGKDSAPAADEPQDAEEGV